MRNNISVLYGFLYKYLKINIFNYFEEKGGYILDTLDTSHQYHNLDITTKKYPNYEMLILIMSQ